MNESRRFVLALCASCTLHVAFLLALDAQSAASSRGVGRAPLMTVGFRSGAAARGDSLVLAQRAPVSLPLQFQSAAVLATDDGQKTPLPIPAELEYLPPDKLDRRPEVQGEVDIYPSFLGTYAGEGIVVLVLYVGSTGRVDKMEVESSDLPPIFAETAMEAFRRATFAPAQKNGEAANARVRVEISYEYLNNR